MLVRELDAPGWDSLYRNGRNSSTYETLGLGGRAGRVSGQPARTREVKPGCVFTQTSTDDQGLPVRDEASATDTGAIETAELFGRRLYAEAWDRGWDGAAKKSCWGMARIGSENVADQDFVGAIQIVDLWHAREHIRANFVASLHATGNYGSRLKQSGMFWTVRGANAIMVRAAAA